MKKNVILVVALFALMTGVLSAQTYDSESDFKVTPYVAGGSGIMITQYLGKKTVVSIPPSIKTESVTCIGGGAFEDEANITSVTIPNSVISIESSAFRRCAKLASITIPNGVKNIGHQAFRDCTSLISVTFQGTIIETNFGSSASNTFPGDLRDKYFAGGIGTYTRPNGTSTTWTKQTTAQPTATPAQSGDPESDFQVKKDGNTITITKYVGTKTAVSIPPAIQNTPVTKIGNSAFANASVTSVTIPDSVSSIDTMAFVNCTKLTSITIPSKINSIGAMAFQGCNSLTSVTFAGQIMAATFHSVDNTFPGDLRAKYYATNAASGTAGTYTRPNGTSTTWTKK